MAHAPISFIVDAHTAATRSGKVEHVGQTHIVRAKVADQCPTVAAIQASPECQDVAVVHGIELDKQVLRERGTNVEDFL